MGETVVGIRGVGAGGTGVVDAGGRWMPSMATQGSGCLPIIVSSAKSDHLPLGADSMLFASDALFRLQTSWPFLARRQPTSLYVRLAGSPLPSPALPAPLAFLRGLRFCVHSWTHMSLRLPRNSLYRVKMLSLIEATGRVAPEAFSYGSSILAFGFMSMRLGAPVLQCCSVASLV